MSGCATVSLKDSAKRQIGFVPYTNTQYEEKADTYPVDLFFSDSKPSKSYDVIGEITGSVRHSENIRPMLEARARQVGGDGVIEIQITAGKEIQGGTTYYSYGMAYGGPRTVNTNDIRAKVIRYKQ